MKHKIFSCAGIEVEYMIVDKKTLDIKPIADLLLKEAKGKMTSDYRNKEITWSNELVSHLIELKTEKPMKDFEKIARLLSENIKKINKILEKHNCKLMPSSMHPWMNPSKETVLWKHDYNKIYEKYNEIFSCKGHGWSNIQSVHLNLPFANDKELRQLNSATRIILPLLPAICASSPIIEGKKGPYSDTRLKYYYSNQKKVPTITGQVVPEVIKTKKEYKKIILEPMYKEIKTYDQEGLLKEEWLNSRGAIARFDRNAIEIRLMDVQENPYMDLAISNFVFETLKHLLKKNKLEEMEKISCKELKKILMECTKKGEKAVIKNKKYLKILGVNKTKAKDILKELAKKTKIPTKLKKQLNTILTKGTLSTRIMKDIKKMDKKNIHKTYNKLTTCLEKNKPFKTN